MKIEVIFAGEADLASILPLVSAFHEFENLSSTASEREASVRKLLTEPKLGGIWLVEVEHELAGYIALCVGYSIEFGGFDAFVDEFYLHCGYRGQGVGKKVLQLIKPEAAGLGIKALHLEVARDNASARKLYADAGFAAREKYLLMSCTLEE